MNEVKIRNSFKNVKKDIDEIKTDLHEILGELRKKSQNLESKESKEKPIQQEAQKSNKIFTSKVTVTDDIRRSVNEVFDSGIFSYGEKVKEFEKKFSEYCGAKYGVAVSNGTVSIELILRSLNIGKGDEIVVPSHTTMPTVEPILHVGAKPVFAEISEENYNISPEDISKKITKKTKAVVVVHLYGNPVNLDEISDICQKNQIHLIEDCAQAHGSRYNGKHVGTFGIAGSFSFYPTKNLTVCGEGGMIITNNDGIEKHSRMMANHGESGRYNHVILGSNYRLSEIHSAIGIKQLEMLESFVARRREIAKIYDEEFKNENAIITPKETENSKHSYHLYVIRVNSKIRDKVVEEMKKENIFLGIHYPTPVHKQPVIKNIMKVPKLPITERIVKEIISLPIYPLLKDDEAKVIASKIKKTIKKLSHS